MPLFNEFKWLFVQCFFRCFALPETLSPIFGIFLKTTLLFVPLMGLLSGVWGRQRNQCLENAYTVVPEVRLSAIAVWL